MQTIMEDAMSTGKTIGLGGLRRGWFCKASSAATLFFFTFVFYLSPTGSAIAAEAGQDDLRQQQIEAVLENTPEKKLAHRLEKLKTKMLKDIPAAQQQREEDSSLWDNIIAYFSGGGSLTDAELSELEQLKLDIDAAWQDAATAFEDMEQKLIDKGLPQVAIERQQQAKADFYERYNVLHDKLDALLQNVDEATFNDLQNFLKQQQFKRRHTDDDPKRMPFGTPDSNVRAPLTEAGDLQAYLGVDALAGLKQFAATGVTQDMLDAAFARPDGPTSADLAETPDIQLTDAIRAKAEELGHDPIAIYTWVHNNIRFIPSYGSIQGADMTLQTLRGNATDTASLLIALLRASNIPARYAYGVIDVPVDQAMNWVGGVEAPYAALNLMGQGGIPSIGRSSGGVINQIRLEHTWVEAYVDFEPSRGVKLHDLDSWVPMDASFKQYDFTEGYNLEDNVPFDPQPLVDQINATATINESEGWVQNVPQQAVEDQLSQFQQQLEDYINNQNPDATVGEVLGLKALKIIDPEPLSAGLPYQLVVKSQHYSEVPDNQRHKFQYSLSFTDGWGSPTTQILSLTQNTVELAGRKLALSFSPATEDDAAIIESYLPEPDPTTGEIDPNQLPDTLPGYLIHLTAEFSQDGETLYSGNAGTMGGELYEQLGIYSPAKGWTTSRNYPTAGEYRAIGLDLQGTSPEQALQLQQNIEATQAKLESSDPTQLQTLTKHDVVGDLIYGTIFSYFALNNVQDEIAQQSAHIVSYRAPSYGLFTTSLNTQYWFGVPRNVQFSGLSMDVDYASHQTVDKQNSQQGWINYNRAIGSRYSAMEHLVPEEMFSTDTTPAQGISAVKAIALASAEGQRIYTITSDNLYTAMAQLQLSADTEQEIQNAVEAGFEVTTHQYQLNFNGWVGEGYIIIDPNTGAGAYKIAGGGNGGMVVKIPSLEIPGIVKDVLLVLFNVVAVGVDALSMLEEILAKTDSSIKNIFRAASEYLYRIGILIDVYEAFKRCPISNALVALVPILLLVIIVPLMLGPQGFALAPLAIFVGSLVAGILASLASGAYIEDNCEAS